MIWAVGILLVLALAGWLALQFAISRNGPAVVDAIDRLTGSERRVVLVERASYGPSAAQKLAVHAALVGGTDGSESRPVILFMHGGSWNAGDPDDYGFVARGLAPAGFVVVLAGYRLHPDAVFPAMLEDTAAAIAWTRAHIARHGGDPDRIVLAGHSAGAYNVVMTALDRQWLGREGLGSDAIAGVVGLAGPYAFYPFDSESTKASFGGAPRPEATQPVNFARADAPPLLLMTGERDTTVRPRNTRALARAIEAAGGPVETRYFAEMDHNAILLAIASPWRRDRRVIEAIAEFARSARRADKASVPVQGETG